MRSERICDAHMAEHMRTGLCRPKDDLSTPQALRTWQAAAKARLACHECLFTSVDDVEDSKDRIKKLHERDPHFQDSDQGVEAAAKEEKQQSPVKPDQRPIVL